MATLSAATNIPMADKTPSQPRMSRKRFRQPSESAEDEDAPGHLSTKKYRVFTLAGAGSLVRSTVERATSSVSLALRRQERLKEGSSKYESEHSSLPSSGLSLDKEVSSKESIASLATRSEEKLPNLWSSSLPPVDSSCQRRDYTSPFSPSFDSGYANPHRDSAAASSPRRLSKAVSHARLSAVCLTPAAPATHSQAGSESPSVPPTQLAQNLFRPHPAPRADENVLLDQDIEDEQFTAALRRADTLRIISRYDEPVHDSNLPQPHETGRLACIPHRLDPSIDSLHDLQAMPAPQPPGPASTSVPSPQTTPGSAPPDARAQITTAVQLEPHIPLSAVHRLFDDMDEYVQSILRRTADQRTHLTATCQLASRCVRVNPAVDRLVGRVVDLLDMYERDEQWTALSSEFRAVLQAAAERYASEYRKV